MEAAMMTLCTWSCSNTWMKYYCSTYSVHVYKGMRNSHTVFTMGECHIHVCLTMYMHVHVHVCTCTTILHKKGCNVCCYTYGYSRVLTAHIYWKVRFIKISTYQHSVCGFYLQWIWPQPLQLTQTCVYMYIHVHACDIYITTLNHINCVIFTLMLLS